jgi:UDP-glucuronate decarboxylase
MSQHYQFDKKRVLVTGGAGFLGSHLCERLLNDDCTVISVDNLYCGSESNVSAFKNDARFTFIRHDITEPLSVYVDEIYNLACPASPVHYQRYPIETLKTSVIGALNLLELARRTKAKILQASTSEVYGDPHVHPQPESYWGNVNTIGIRSCYDEGKRCAETLFADYRRIYGVDTKLVRIFNTYGPRMHPSDGRVVSNFIVQALRNEPLTIFGEGQQTRSFCYATDLIDGFIKMMATPDTYMGPVNLGNPSEFTIKQLADLVIELTKSMGGVCQRPLPADDPKVRRPDITKAQEVLQWQPTVQLREGLEKTIPYFAELIKGQ